MNWEAIGAIGEIVSAMAVFVSLIYLAVQIRQNTRQIVSSIDATHLAALERNIESGNRTREFFLTNPELTELYRKGCKSYALLDRSEKTNFGLMVRNVFASTQGAYIRQLSLGHDPEGFDSIARVVDEIISAPGIREFLESNQPDWRPEFRVFVGERLQAISNTTG
jgi:hypothetical protein